MAKTALTHSRDSQPRRLQPGHRPASHPCLHEVPQTRGGGEPRSGRGLRSAPGAFPSDMPTPHPHPSTARRRCGIPPSAHRGGGERGYGGGGGNTCSFFPGTKSCSAVGYRGVLPGALLDGEPSHARPAPPPPGWVSLVSWASVSSSENWCSTRSVRLHGGSGRWPRRREKQRGAGRKEPVLLTALSVCAMLSPPEAKEPPHHPPGFCPLLSRSSAS